MTLEQIIAESPTAAEALEVTKRYNEYKREADSTYIPLWESWADSLTPGDRRSDAFRESFCDYSGASKNAPLTLMFVAFCGGVDAAGSLLADLGLLNDKTAPS